MARYLVVDRIDIDPEHEEDRLVELIERAKNEKCFLHVELWREKKD